MDATMQNRWMTLQEVAEYLAVEQGHDISACSKRKDSCL